MTDKRLHKMVNGKKVYLTPEEEQIVRKRWAEEKNKLEERERLQGYKKRRKKEYPDIGDQLDALLKQLNYDRLNGRELVTDLDTVIGDWLAVKSKYPKPGTE